MIDPRIEKAIMKAVTNADQGSEVAAKLVAWLDGIMSGTEQIENNDATALRVGALYDAVVLSEGLAEDDS